MDRGVEFRRGSVLNFNQTTNEIITGLIWILQPVLSSEHRHGSGCVPARTAPEPSTPTLSLRLMCYVSAPRSPGSFLLSCRAANRCMTSGKPRRVGARSTRPSLFFSLFKLFLYPVGALSCGSPCHFGNQAISRRCGSAAKKSSYRL